MKNGYAKSCATSLTASVTARVYRVWDSPRLLIRSLLTFCAFPPPNGSLQRMLDVWSRLDSLKAAITSVHGRILKINSTKKICKKL